MRGRERSERLSYCGYDGERRWRDDEFEIESALSLRGDRRMNSIAGPSLFLLFFLAYLLVSNFHFVDAFTFATALHFWRIIFAGAAGTKRSLPPKKGEYAFLIELRLTLAVAAIALALQFFTEASCQYPLELLAQFLHCEIVSREAYLTTLACGYLTIGIVALACMLWPRNQTRYSRAADVVTIRLIRITGSRRTGRGAVLLTCAAVACLSVVRVSQGMAEVLFLVGFCSVVLAVVIAIANSQLGRSIARKR